VIAGIGNLGHALANYKGFEARGFRVAALVDVDPAKIGERVGALEVDHIDRLPELVRSHGIAIGVIATPAAAVQDVGDRLVAAGLRSILNFAPAPLSAPPGVSVRSVDLAVELQILAYYEQRKAALADVRKRGGAVAFAPTR
jgi:redox-sensing transcriptional repressor